MSKKEIIKEIIEILKMQNHIDDWNGSVPLSKKEYAEIIYNKFIKNNNKK